MFRRWCALALGAAEQRSHADRLVFAVRTRWLRRRGRYLCRSSARFVRLVKKIVDGVLARSVCAIRWALASLSPCRAIAPVSRFGTLTLRDIQRLYFELLLGQFLDRCDSAFFGTCHQHDRHAAHASSTGAANAMDVVLGCKRNVVINDDR